MWTVGQLADLAGLTVRTLHHWDALGLLTPAERTYSGHRRYGEAELRRLYAIVALRRLGLSLEDVAAVLERDGDGVREALDAQLAAVERALEGHRRLRERLIAVRGALNGGTAPTTEQLIDLIEVTTMTESYYTPEQLGELRERAEALGPDGMARAQQDWADLIAEAQALRADGVDPADERVQAIVRRWDALIEQFTGGNPEIRANLQRMYEEQGPQQASRGMVDPELMAWVASARTA